MPQASSLTLAERSTKNTPFYLVEVEDEDEL
jgi:hypothetical protein